MPLPQVQKVTRATKLGKASGTGGYRLKPGDASLPAILRNPTSREALPGSPDGPTIGPAGAGRGNSGGPVGRAGGKTQAPAVTGKG